MAQKKLLRFAQLKTFPNVLEYPKDMKGNWQTFFKNKHPLVLELACGRGEYTVGLAAFYPEHNFLGVDVKGNRMYIGAKYALENGLANAGFLRTQIEMLAEYFAVGEVDEIWITFPDPQLRTSTAKRRLTHPRFLRLYQQVLKPGGSIHLKTDSPALFHFTKRVIELYGLFLVEETEDVYAQPHKTELDIKTHYEGLDIAQSKKIYYLHFKLTGSIPVLDDQLQEELKLTEHQNLS
ncbi:MAG: tRNA (guanosine(46)-N7)-methyltransferase TrmB [Gloeobacteraceae cyanobacterium ES-bin-316]|nr:tRNA (guanosine(46)-N7)-methyltransferase TrmB [Ferruginibacter sp.]